MSKRRSATKSATGKPTSVHTIWLQPASAAHTPFADLDVTLAVTETAARRLRDRAKNEADRLAEPYRTPVTQETLNKTTG